MVNLKYKSIYIKKQKLKKMMGSFSLLPPLLFITCLKRCVLPDRLHFYTSKIQHSFGQGGGRSGGWGGHALDINSMTLLQTFVLFVVTWWEKIFNVKSYTTVITLLWSKLLEPQTYRVLWSNQFLSFHSFLPNQLFSNFCHNAAKNPVLESLLSLFSFWTDL